MSLSFFEAVKNSYLMPTGGLLNVGEIAGLDPSPTGPNAAAIASGTVAASGAPPAFVAQPTQRVKFTAATMVQNSPPLYAPGEIATFLAPISAALIAQGLAVAN
jgi:hypothetical protein